MVELDAVIFNFLLVFVFGLGYFFRKYLNELKQVYTIVSGYLLRADQSGKVKPGKYQLYDRRIHRHHVADELDVITQWLYEQWDDSSEQLLDFLSKKLSKVLDVEIASVWLLYEEGMREGYECIYNSSVKEYGHEVNPSVQGWQDFFDYLKKNTIIVETDLLESGFGSKAEKDHATDMDIRASIDVGILRGDKILGALTVEHCKTARQWTDEEVEFLRSVSCVLSLALSAEIQRPQDVEEA